MGQMHELSTVIRNDVLLCIYVSRYIMSLTLCSDGCVVGHTSEGRETNAVQTTCHRRKQQTTIDSEFTVIEMRT